MLRRRISRACAAAALAAFLVCPLAPRASAQDKVTGKKLTLAVIPKGTTHEFWKQIHAGAVKGSQDVGCEIIWKGPQREDDREMQIQVIEDFITRKVDGILLAPLDDKALVRPVRDAKRAGIPVVIFDSGLQGKDFASFVATDNFKGGQLGAERLGTLLGGKGKVLLLRYQEGSASTTQREEGFLDVMKKKFPGIELISANQYAGATSETASKKADDLLNRFKEIDGIFCVNESSTFGMLRSLANDGRAGKVKFVGFDSSEKLIQAMKDGQIHGLVQQNPFKMAELAVKTMVQHLDGKPVEKFIDTGVTVVTKENMDQPEIKDLLYPPLDKYLK